MHGQNHLKFKLSVTEHSDVVNVGMAKQSEGRRLALWLVGCGVCCQVILKYKCRIVN